MKKCIEGCDRFENTLYDTAHICCIQCTRWGQHTASCDKRANKVSSVKFELEDINNTAKSHGRFSMVLFANGAYACSCGVRRLFP